MTMRSRWAESNASPWTILIRLAVGLVVFFPEGIQKLIFPDILGAGRFAKIGIPGAEIMGPFVGVVELVCGALIILGLFTRWATIPLIVTMIVALVSTKLPILLGEGFGVNRRPKRTPYRRAKGTPFVEQRDGYDGRCVRAGCGVGRA